MMYGSVEEPEDILIHLDTLRKAQDEIPGFTAFIPWSYKRDRTLLRRAVKNWAGVDAYLRILAFSVSIWIILHTSNPRGLVRVRQLEYDR